MADLKWEGRMDQLKGLIREKWGAITDDDVDRAQGNRDQLIGKIKERTGETEESIRQKLDEIDTRV